MSNEGERLKKIRTLFAGIKGQRNGDIIKGLNTVTGVTAQNYNGAWIQFVNVTYSKSFGNVSDAKTYLANQLGFDSFSQIDNLDAAFASGGSSAASALLLETGDYILLESGDRILLE